MKVSHEPPDIENLMKLNPRIKPFTNAVPSAVTKKVSFKLRLGDGNKDDSNAVLYVPLFETSQV